MWVDTSLLYWLYRHHSQQQSRRIFHPDSWFNTEYFFFFVSSNVWVKSLGEFEKNHLRVSPGCLELWRERTQVVSQVRPSWLKQWWDPLAAIHHTASYDHLRGHSSYWLVSNSTVSQMGKARGVAWKHMGPRVIVRATILETTNSLVPFLPLTVRENKGYAFVNIMTYSL